MASVTWTDPSDGTVSDPKPSLTLLNHKGGALSAKSRGMAVFAMSPHNTAVAGGNQGVVPAIGGAAVADPAAPSNLNGIAVLGVTDRFSATGVLGVAFKERSVGVRGEADIAGVGVVGVGGIAGVQGTSKRGHGVIGTTSALQDEAGVLGQAQGDGGSGVRGIAVAGPGAEGRSVAGPGVRGSSDQAQGVVGEAKAGNAAGVFGRNDAGTGVGVDAYSVNGTALRATASKGKAIDATTFSGTAVKVNSTTGAGIDCYAGGGPAVKAESFGGTAIVASSLAKAISATALGGTSTAPGAAVEGTIMVNGDAVKGTAAFNGAGVHGTGYTALGCWAGLFDGDVSVKGILYKYASLFSIDHPLDPDRRSLNHAAVEAPEYKTFYDGVATLAKDGRALVRLPHWFAALNGELRHQLTALGAPAPDLHVRSVKKDSFVISGGAAGQRVCWQVTGIRRDAWARKNPLKVETPKRRAPTSAAPPSATELTRLRRTLEKELADARKSAAASGKRRPPSPSRRPRGGPPAPAALSKASESAAHQLVTATRHAMKK
jgi:hypothetical protein